MWSYRTFALVEVSPQRYKEWQHYSYRGKQYVPPNAQWFSKGYLAIGCPFKTAVHDCSLALTYSLRNMPQILCFHLALLSHGKSYWQSESRKWFCGRAKKMPSDRSKVEIYYFMSSVTAQNKFLAGTFFLSSNYKISYSYLKRKIKKLSYCVNSYTK